MEKQLLSQMEQLRVEMVETALRHNLQHSDVLTLSQSLDELIVLAQLERRARTQVN